MRFQQRFRRRPLQERACFLVDGLAKKVVRARVADVELDRRIELHQLDEIRFASRVGIGGGPVLDKPRRHERKTNGEDSHLAAAA